MFKVGTFDVRSLQAALGKLEVHQLPRCAAAKQISPVEVNFGSVSLAPYATLDYQGVSISAFCLDNPLEARVSGQLAKVVAKARP